EIFKIQGDDIGSKLLFAGIRFAAAGLMVLAVLGVQTRQRPLPKKGAFKHLLTLGILQTTIQYYFFYVGLAHTTGAKGS
ncbi:EamA family transporter, partial [Faecalibacillus faecis]